MEDSFQKLAAEFSNPGKQCQTCFLCGNEVSFFKMKIPRKCIECQGQFCVDCTRRIPEKLMDRRCLPCSILATKFTLTDLRNLKPKSLKRFLISHKISVSHCKEKEDLVQLVAQSFKERVVSLQSQTATSMSMSATDLRAARERCFPSDDVQTREDHNSPSPPLNRQPPSYHDLENTETSTSRVPIISEETAANLAGEESPPINNPFKGLVQVKLNQILTIEQISLLSVNQLMQMLADNCIRLPKGVLMKEELTSKVRELWVSEQNKKAAVEADSLPDSDLCKICMTDPMDCVFLNCGHMAACITCGKQLTECPFCRAFIVNTVKVFKT